MKLSEFKNEKAIDVLADILEPVQRIITNDKVQKLVNGEYTYIELAKTILKNCKSDIILILAILNDTPVNEYECSFFSILQDLIELLKTPEILDFFKLQGLEMKSSGSATENTEETDKT